MAKPRARALGLHFAGTPGPLNAITDVPGISVGATTVIEPAQPGVHNGLCTGVTAILPRPVADTMQPLWAGVHSFNGNGELTGSHWIKDGGWFLGPVMLTNTHSVGIVHHAVVKWMCQTHAATLAETHQWFMPVVGETYDGVLNDINAQAITAEHALAAINTAQTGPVAEGNTGGGAGMIAYEFKAGTGTASRRVNLGGQDFTVGVLVQANHGLRDWLHVSGVPVGTLMRDDPTQQRERGSIIVVIATDCPLLPHQLDRVARRGAIGIGRNGTYGGNSSGDIFLAFSTANAGPIPVQREPFLTLNALNDTHLDVIYAAAVQATEEAVVNALCAAEDRIAVKPPGKRVKAIDTAALVRILGEHGASAQG